MSTPDTRIAREHVRFDDGRIAREKMTNIFRDPDDAAQVCSPFGSGEDDDSKDVASMSPTLAPSPASRRAVGRSSA